MEAVQIKKACANMKFCAKIMWRGFCKMVYGELVACLIAMAVYGFVSVTNESGWTAVFDFITSCATVIVAIANIYWMGCRKKGANHG